MTNSPEPAPVRDSKRKRDDSDGKCKKKSKKRRRSSTGIAPEGSVTGSTYSQSRATSETHTDSARSSTRLPSSSSKPPAASCSDNYEALLAKNANTGAKRLAMDDRVTPLSQLHSEIIQNRRRNQYWKSAIRRNDCDIKAPQSSISTVIKQKITQPQNVHFYFRETGEIVNDVPNDTHARQKPDTKPTDDHGLCSTAEIAPNDELKAKLAEEKRVHKEKRRKLRNKLKVKRETNKIYQSKLKASQKETERVTAEFETLRQEMERMTSGFEALRAGMAMSELEASRKETSVTSEREERRKEMNAMQAQIEDLKNESQSDLKRERKRRRLLAKEFLKLQKKVNRKPISYKHKVTKQEVRVQKLSKQKNALTQHAQNSRQITAQEPHAHAECAPVCKRSMDESMRRIEAVKQPVVLHQHRHFNRSGKGSTDRVETLEKRLENVETKQIEDVKEIRTCLREKATATDVTDLTKQLSQFRSRMDAGTNLVDRVAALEAYRAAEALVSLKTSDHCIYADFRERVEKHMQWDDIRFGFLQGLILCLWQKTCNVEGNVTKLDNALQERFRKALNTIMPSLGRLEDQFKQYDDRFDSHSGTLNKVTSDVVLNTAAQNRRLDECELKCKCMRDENAHLQGKNEHLQVENGHLKNNVDYLRNQILQSEQGASVANNDAAHSGDSQNTVSREEFDDCCSKLDALLAEVKTLHATVKGNENIARQIVPFIRLYVWKFNKKISKEKFAEEMSKLESGELLSDHEETESTTPLPQLAPVESLIPQEKPASKEKSAPKEKSTLEEQPMSEDKSAPKEKPAPRREPISKRTRSQQAKPQEAPPPKPVIAVKDPESIEGEDACCQDKDKDMDKDTATLRDLSIEQSSI